MIKIIDVVSELLKSDELASESLREGLLNLSAYAEKIQKQVENVTFKDVKKGTIVVALSRLAKNFENSTPLKPELKLTNIDIKSSLSAIIYDKTPDIQRKIAVLHPFQLSVNDIFAISEGPNEITIICSQKSQEKILKSFDAPIKYKFEDLVALTVQYDEKHAQTPNIYYVLVSALATKRINIIDMIATYTEISFIVQKSDMEQAIQALNLFFAKSI